MTAMRPPVTLRDGNAFAKRAGWSDDSIRQVMDEATAGDYDHLLQTVMRYFEVETDDCD